MGSGEFCQQCGFNPQSTMLAYTCTNYHALKPIHFTKITLNWNDLLRLWSTSVQAIPPQLTISLASCKHNSRRISQSKLILPWIRLNRLFHMYNIQHLAPLSHAALLGTFSSINHKGRSKSRVLLFFALCHLASKHGMIPTLAAVVKHLRYVMIHRPG